QPLEALAVIVATGRTWANPLQEVADEHLWDNGISTAAVDDGTLPRFRNRPVVVLAETDAALGEAEYLTRFASLVALVHEGCELRRHWLSRVRAAALLTHPRIEVRPRRGIVRVVGTPEEGVTAVRLRHLDTGVGEELLCTGIFLAADFTRPNTDFLHG